MKRFSLFVILALLSTAAFAGGAVIKIVNNNAPGVGFNDPTVVAPVGGNPGTTLGQQRLNAFQFAADIWSSTLDSNAEIRIRAQFVPLSCTATSAVLGSAGATFVFRDFPGAPLAATWYNASLTGKLFGADPLAPTAQHLNANFNVNLGAPGCLAGRGWYLGFDANEGTQIDLVAVLLHEFGHGLGFQTFTSLGSGAPFSGFTDVYATNLLNASTSKLYPQMTNAERVAASVNSRNLVWNGSHVTDAVPTVLRFGVPLLNVSSPASVAGKYSVGTAGFGNPLTAAGITGDVVQALDAADAAGPTPFDACSTITSPVAGKIAMVDRGTCGFIVKVKNAQNAGAIAVIVADNAAGSPPAGLGGVDSTITIPSVRITQADGNALKAALASSVVSVNLGLDMTARAGAHPILQKAQMYAPNPAEGGSSVSHWDTIASRNQLMEPSINSDLTHSLTVPEDMTLALMRDIGWYPDGDLDMVSDEGLDQCLGTDFRATINIGACDSRVASPFNSATGCTRADLINKIAASARNHGEFVSGVSHLSNQWKKNGDISGAEHAAIVSCAAGSTLP